MGSGASYSFNHRIARKVLKSTQRVPQSQDCTKFQDCVGCTILGLRVRNRGCCAHNTRTRKRTQIWQQTRGGWAAVGNTKQRNTNTRTNTREIREEQMDRPAAVGRGRFKPLVIVIVIAALRHDQFANASLGAGSLNVRRGPRGMQTRFSSADTELVGLSHGAKGVEVPARVKPSCRALMRRCLLTTRRKAVPLQDAAPDFLRHCGRIGRETWLRL